MGPPLQVVEHLLEAGTMGAALTVAVGMAVYPGVDAVDDQIRIDDVVEPRRSLERRYGRMCEEYRRVYDALAPVFRRIHTTP